MRNRKRPTTRHPLPTSHSSLPTSHFRLHTCLLGLCLAAVFTAAPLWAQEDPVEQEKYKNGLMPTGTYDGALTTVNTQNGGYTVAVPLFGLPGRAGMDLSLTLTYNSKQLARRYDGNQWVGRWFNENATVGRWVLNAWYQPSGAESRVVVWQLDRQKEVASYLAERVMGGFLATRELLLLGYPDRIEFYRPPDWDHPERVLPNPEYGDGIAWHSFVLSPDDSHAAFFSSDSSGGQSLRLLDLNNGNVSWRLDMNDYRSWKVSLSAGAKYLALVAPDLRTTEVWEVEKGLLLKKLAPSESERVVKKRGIEDLSLSPDGKLLASIHLDAFVRMFDVDSGRESRRLDFDLFDTHRRVSFSPGGDYLAVLAAGPPNRPDFPVGPLLRYLSLWSVHLGRYVCQQPGWFESAVAETAFSGDGRFLAVKEAFRVGHGWNGRKKNYQWFFAVYKTAELTGESP